MDQRPFTFLERMTHDRQRELVAEAQRLAAARRAQSEDRARVGWRVVVAALGRALVGLGSRLAALERAGRVPAPT